MNIYTDQLSRKISINDSPHRIISLVPSQTELLYELGLEDRVIAITKFCIHPSEWFQTKTRIGGTKDFKVNLIKSLQPDLIIANKEENDQEQLLSLMNEFPVWISDISTLDEAYEMISEIGLITKTKEKADHLLKDIKNGFTKLDSFVKHHPKEKNKAAYFIWNNPYMSIGDDTFIAEMMRKCGLEITFREAGRYPEISNEELVAAKPDLILLSSEPFPFKDKHAEEMQKLLPDSKVLLVDGEFFSWYGSRLKSAPAYFEKLLNSF